MIGMKDIVKAINLKIKHGFPKVEIQSEDIKEGFKRPSFFVDIDEDKASSFNSITKEKTSSVRIYYFPSDRYKNRIELLETQDRLEELFIGGLQVSNNFFISIEELNFSKTDGVLQLSFELYSIQEIEDTEQYELIEDIEFETKIN